MRHGKFLALIVAAVILAAPAMAGDYKFTKSEGDERFALVMPDSWTLSSVLVTEMYFDYQGKKSDDDDLAAVASLIPGDTPLADQRVLKYIDLGKGPTVTTDRTFQQAGFPARRIDGTAISEGSKLFFSSIALKSAANREIYMLTIWGSPSLWQRPDIKSQVDSMLASFKPL